VTDRLAPKSQSRLEFFPWPTLLIGIVLARAVLPFVVKPDSVLLSFSPIAYFLLLLLATSFAIRNAIQNTLGTRFFWVSVAAAYSIWALNQSIFLYYEHGPHIDVPDDSIADPLLFLHIVPLMAAVAILPRRKLSGRKLYRAILNSLLLLFFWSFLYVYAVFPYQYLFSNTTYALRFDSLYLLENVVLVSVVAISSFRVEVPWKSIYLHLLGATTLYTLSSAVANIAIDSGGYVSGKLYGAGLVGSACWFVWIPLRARWLARAEVEETRSEIVPSSKASEWAMLLVVLISIPVVWELFRRDEPTGMRTFRLLVAVAAIVCLAGAAYINEYLAKSELASHLGLANDQLRAAVEALSGMNRRVIEAEERERNRIAKDLHEDIGQRLTLLAIRIEQLKNELPNQAVELLDRMDAVWKQTLEVLADVKASAHELHSPRLEYLGIAKVMKSFCEEFGKRKGIEIAFRHDDVPSLVPPDVSICLFRVLQEALHNGVNHSGVQNFDVRLWGASEEIHLLVRDSGAGFDLEAVRKGQGLGLIRMEQRVKLVTGTFSIDSQPGRGTTVHVSVPLSSGRDFVPAIG
jgi:signal transduction histidine kinase